MGFLSRFRRTSRQISDPEQIAGESNENTTPPAVESKGQEWDEKKEEVKISEWESPDTLDMIEKGQDKKSRKLSQRITSSSKVASRSSKITTGKLIPRPSNGLNIDIEHLLNRKSRRRISPTPVFERMMAELETTLLESDMGHSAVDAVLSEMRSKLIGAPLPRKGEIDKIIDAALISALDSLLRVSYWDFNQTVESIIQKEDLAVIMLVGVNGTGKTTTAAKIAHRMIKMGYSVVLGAADTFRAGAIDQLSDHAQKVGARVVKSQRGGDSAAIARDAVDSAKAKGDEIVIIDTAGRMQNKTNLMQELKKVHRVVSPHLVLFVGDALAGNDAVEQARIFQSFLNFDGAVLSKLDTDARGGAALSIAHSTNRPIVLAGIGQDYDDLTDFEPSGFLTDLLSDDIDFSRFRPEDGD